jgi:hypothetical protein
VGGLGWKPSTEFFGAMSDEPIERVIVQPEAHGNVDLIGIHMFARRQHLKTLR